MAGKIPQRFIDDLLDRVDIVDVVGSRLDLRKTGKNHSARCPFHDEKTPSFSVSPDKQFYYCFGCGAGGNALGFVMDYDHIDFPRAVELLASQAGMTVPTEGSRDDEQTRLRRQLYTSLEIADQFYQGQLRQESNKQISQQANSQAGNPAVNYLRSRGLSGEIAKTFGIGFAPPGWDNLMALAEGDERKIEQFIHAGLLVHKEDSGRIYDRFRHRVMFPIRDSRGRTIAFGGRVLGDDKPKYLNSPESPVFQKGRELYGLYEASRAGKNMDNLLVVEGYMDVVALAQFDITNAVATLGTSVSVEHLQKIFRYTKVVIFCFDGDEAGRKAAQRAMETCLPTMQDGRSAKFLFLPEGEDPDTLVREIGTDAFNKLLTKATPLSTFLFDSLTPDLDLDLPDDCARLSQLAAPLINRLPMGVFHQLMIDLLAKKTGIASGTLEKLLPEKTSEPPSWQSRPSSPLPSTPGSEQDSFEHAHTEQYGEYETGGYNEQLQGNHQNDQPNWAEQGLPDQGSARPGNTPHSPTDKKLNLAPAHWLIALLAHHPKLLTTIEDTHLKQLEDLDAPGMEILLPLIDLLRDHPDYSLNHVLGYWRGRGEEQGEQLTKIVNSDLITAPGSSYESSQSQVADIVTNLLRGVVANQPVEQQIEHLTNKMEFTNEDQKTAIELWHKLTADNAAPELILAAKQLVSKATLAKK